MKNKTNTTTTVKSFAELAKVMHQRDIQAAERLRKSAPLRKGKTTLAIARPQK